MARWAVRRAFGLLVAALAAASVHAADLELQLRADGRQANAAGPLAQANAAWPGLVSATPSGATLQAEGRGALTLGAGWSLQGNAVLARERLAGGTGGDHSRVNEAHLAWDGGPWQLAVGRKVLGWDVGYAFRPNDVVQQEERRTQLGQTPQGRPLLQLERFDPDRALALVLVQPGRWRQADDAQRGAREAAVAARGYWREGALDLHAFARHGQHTGASAGAALAWVATDELELHASARAFRRHDGWSFTGPVTQPAHDNPWTQATLGGGSQWLLGAQWTGGPQLSLLAEAWHDGSAPSDAQWRQWRERGDALALLAAAPATSPQAALRPAAAANVAWQATPLQGPGLRRDNLYLRLAWQPADWTLSVDALFNPADAGHAVSAGLQLKTAWGRLDASWRRHGGPASSLQAQLPVRQSLVLAATAVF